MSLRSRVDRLQDRHGAGNATLTFWDWLTSLVDANQHNPISMEQLSPTVRRQVEDFNNKLAAQRKTIEEMIIEPPPPG
jgi:hypothetical protein